MFRHLLRAYEEHFRRRALLSLVLAPFVLLAIFWILRLIFLEYYGPLMRAVKSGELPF